MACLLSLWLGGCAVVPEQGELNRHAQSLAQAGGLVRAQVQTEGFVLTSFYRITRLDQPLTVYIEGDGFAWRTRSQPSLNPTPIKALGLALAAKDPAANVVYLARPCQFTPMAANPGCDMSDWTSKRFAEAVVMAMNQAVGQYAARVPGQPLNLVGYSGGGTIAALLAARRTDVASLRTVAGNLDVAEVNRLHRVTPMPGSLNPIDLAPRLSHLPQIHYVGSEDTVVPASIAQGFARAVGGRCTQVRLVPGMGHDSDWAQRWPELLREPATCSLP
ncbi:alpha/beta hydrolase [Pseudomonas kairouanensis]|uniref:Alpha/beta hydrolase n=1 Tax=Pseudomonas kairouanensis TaxID=2293832 RepID=A0A4Z0AT68_9PSED|nr:alpha/beta hydrolase [Pseudomonas kairouanensis]